MDISAIAAVGSFVMSERVLKPKATVLCVLGCILAYDLTKKTHDITALRVYRGPALLAFTLMMSAWSLRTWRRNGVACDELIFLPGTLHGHEHGIEGPLIEMVEPTETSPTNAGEGTSCPTSPQRNAQETPSSSSSTSAAAAANGRASFRNRRSHSEDESRLTEVTEEETNDGGAVSLPDKDLNQGGGDALSASSQHSWISTDPDDTDEAMEQQTHCLLNRGTGEPNDELGVDEMDDNAGGQPTLLQRWAEKHPWIATMGTFFFFRAPGAPQISAYAPSGPAVFGAGLDLCMPVLFNFHLFIEAYDHMQKSDEEEASDATAKILPLIFLSVLIVRTVIPPGRRFHFWGIMKFTFTAPLYEVRFRDELIGDALTSWVRPGQDLFFAYSYYVTVIWGTISGHHNLEESGNLLVDSWMLHNVLMPSFAILPLWLKYLQTLRQAYDSNKRWPYQANSLKYLSATLVVIYAITHPANRNTIEFQVCFGLALLFQICWDVFVDWELFEIQRDVTLIDAAPESFCAQISSFRPSSHCLLMVQMYVCQPVFDLFQKIRAIIPNPGQIQLRQKRLYKTQSFYWKILAYNIITRGAWMLCFIPPYHVSRNRTVLTSNSDVNSYWGVILPAAEIIRRTLWGFLFLERETIKLMDADAKYSRVAVGGDEEEEDSKMGDRSFRAQLLPTWLDNQQQVAHTAATHQARERDQSKRHCFVLELYVWAAAFVGLGCWAASG